MGKGDTRRKPQVPEEKVQSNWDRIFNKRGNMSKEYRVGVHFEEGFSVKVKADSEEQANKKVYDMVNEYGACTISDEVPKYHDKKVVHREWLIVDVEEIDQ
tara:strand:- start:134 stop:436 length:303 start_codon:yes stop_codon:yes gene_type:complete